jgi:phosphoglycolate phosphatase
MGTVFLDLDGTLTDPKPGITSSVAYALEKLGLPVPSSDDLLWVIGPPLLDSFGQLGAPDPARALALYRERYTDTGLFDNSVYKGIPEALSRLRDGGHRMCLATAKPHVYARRITAHFDLARWMDHEFGPELDGTRNDKADLLAHALELTGIDPSDSVMIGDRIHDFRAARSVGMTSIAVTWGYGTKDETALADFTCDQPEQLPDTVHRALGG